MAAKKAGGNRASRLRCQFGITEAQYDDLLKQQGGRCFICRKKPRRMRLAIDHDHTTGFIRGLLCNKCNRAIATFKDDTNAMMKAIEYLHQAARRWCSLSYEQQDEWLPFRGRAGGKGRTKRLAKSRAFPMLPPVEMPDDA